jgi:hypothetical protein
MPFGASRLFLRRDFRVQGFDLRWNYSQASALFHELQALWSGIELNQNIAGVDFRAQR